MQKPIDCRITPQAALAMMRSETCTVVDVRTEREYYTGRIGNAILIPEDQILDHARELLPKLDEPVLVYCASGSRSRRAALLLTGLGYRKVYDLGGIESWPFERNLP